MIKLTLLFILCIPAFASYIGSPSSGGSADTGDVVFTGDNTVNDGISGLTAGLGLTDDATGINWSGDATTKHVRIIANDRHVMRFSEASNVVTAVLYGDIYPDAALSGTVDSGYDASAGMTRWWAQNFSQVYRTQYNNNFQYVIERVGALSGIGFQTNSANPGANEMRLKLNSDDGATDVTEYLSTTLSHTKWLIEPADDATAKDLHIKSSTQTSGAGGEFRIESGAGPGGAGNITFYPGGSSKWYMDNSPDGLIHTSGGRFGSVDSQAGMGNTSGFGISASNTRIIGYANMGWISHNSYDLGYRDSLIRAPRNIYFGTAILDSDGDQVLGQRITGWAAATGTATRTTFATTTVTTEQLAERVKALIDDLETHGLIQ